jgi:hypothetical protein
MFTSWSEVSTPAELSMKSVLSSTPCKRGLDAAQLGQPRLPPSPTTLQRSSPPLTRRALLARSPTSALSRSAGLHVGADAAVPQQVDRRRRIAFISSFGAHRRRVGLDAERGRAPAGDSGIDLALRGNTPPPLLISALS